MSRIRGETTSPKLVVRRRLHRMGYRFVCTPSLNATSEPLFAFSTHKTLPIFRCGSKVRP
ncbi:MAG: very short patch repair endonuclease [Verrucomicrobia subdivision 3 bacterium]|nr:very short patch repair endonuclease [Limisphaerales bacterium]